MERKNYWVLRVDSTLVEWRHRPDERRGACLIQTKRHPKIRAGDAIMFYRSSEPAAFIGSASITRIKSFSEGGNAGPVEINYASYVDFDEVRTLVHFRYSLLRVSNVENPERHFRLPYTSIEPVDHMTIQRGEPFLARTAFHEIYDRLPTEMKHRFAGRLIALTGADGFRGQPYARSWAALADFIESEIISIGRVLERLRLVWNGLDAAEGWLPIDEMWALGRDGSQDSIGRKIAEYDLLWKLLEPKHLDWELSFIESDLYRQVSEEISIQAQSFESLDRLFRSRA